MLYRQVKLAWCMEGKYISNRRYISPNVVETMMRGAWEGWKNVKGPVCHAFLCWDIIRMAQGVVRVVDKLTSPSKLSSDSMHKEEEARLSEVLHAKFIVYGYSRTTGSCIRYVNPVILFGETPESIRASIRHDSCSVGEKFTPVVLLYLVDTRSMELKHLAALDSYFADVILGNDASKYNEAHKQLLDEAFSKDIANRLIRPTYQHIKVTDEEAFGDFPTAIIDMVDRITRGGDDPFVDLCDAARIFIPTLEKDDSLLNIKSVSRSDTYLLAVPGDVSVDEFAMMLDSFLRVSPHAVLVTLEQNGEHSYILNIHIFDTLAVFREYMEDLPTNDGKLILGLWLLTYRVRHITCPRVELFCNEDDVAGEKGETL